MVNINRLHQSNPYPSEFVLLYWHDFWKQMVEEHGADWRDQTAYVNANIPEFKSFNAECYWKPWKAIRDAYEAKCCELDVALAIITTLEDAAEEETWHQREVEERNSV